MEAKTLQLSHTWLTEVLRQSGDAGDASVTDIKIEPLRHQGRSSLLFRCTPAFDKNTSTELSSLIFKCPTEDKQIRGKLSKFDGYRREVNFYKADILAGKVWAPKIYYCNESGDLNPKGILMEDLGRGRIGSIFNSHADDASVAIDALAHMHASFWESPLLARLPWLVRFNNTSALEGAAQTFASSLQVVRRTFGNILSTYTLRIAEAWVANFDAALDAMARLPVTLVHGDAHPGQMFFPTREQRRFYLVDWQNATAASGAVDVARFLVMGLKADLRQKFEQDLVARYLGHLYRAHVTQIQAEEFWLHIRLSNLWNLFLNVLAVAESGQDDGFPQTDRVAGFDWQSLILSRTDRAMRDWEVGEALVRSLAMVRHSRP
ncbi:MAG: phosphotransferase [Pseudomonadota bacterium]